MLTFTYLQTVYPYGVMENQSRLGSPVCSLMNISEKQPHWGGMNIEQPSNSMFCNHYDFFYRTTVDKHKKQISRPLIFCASL